MMITIMSEDGCRLAADIHRRGSDIALILAHGFYNNKDAYLFREMALRFKEYYDVIAFDFRGHGKSDGLFGWTSHEVKDLNAVVAWTKEQGYGRIAVIGFSLGAAVALIAAAGNRDIHSVVAVSAPYDFWRIDYRFWEPEMLEDLKLNLGFKGKGKGIRPGNPFRRKVRPIDVAHTISPTPVMFMHGEKDWLIALHHSRKLYVNAMEPKRLEIVADAGHAEKIFDTKPEEFIRLCVGWFTQTLP